MMTNQVIDLVLEKSASMIQKLNCAIRGAQGYKLGRRREPTCCNFACSIQTNVVPLEGVY